MFQYHETCPLCTKHCDLVSNYETNLAPVSFDVDLDELDSKLQWLPKSNKTQLTSDQDLLKIKLDQSSHKIKPDQNHQNSQITQKYFYLVKKLKTKPIIIRPKHD